MCCRVPKPELLQLLLSALPPATEVGGAPAVASTDGKAAEQPTVSEQVGLGHSVAPGTIHVAVAVCMWLCILGLLAKRLVVLLLMDPGGQG